MQRKYGFLWQFLNSVPQPQLLWDIPLNLRMKDFDKLGQMLLRSSFYFLVQLLSLVVVIQALCAHHFALQNNLPPNMVNAYPSKLRSLIVFPLIECSPRAIASACWLKSIAF